MTGPNVFATELAGRTESPSDLRKGTVVEVSARGIVVNVAGGRVPAAHLDSYAPAVGDVVALTRFQDAWLVQGRIVGSATPVDNLSPGSSAGVTTLGAMRTNSGGTLASSTGLEVPIAGYSLTFFHPPGHSVLIVSGYNWYSTAAADWIWLRVRETFSATMVGTWTEPITSALYGRYAALHCLAPDSLGGEKRTYYATATRLTGTGTTTVSHNAQNPGYMIALDVGDQSVVIPV